jgi:mRNA interferase MazF
MTVKRGDVVLAWYPFASGQGGKRRPCLIVQNDPDNQKLANTIVAQITSNLARAGDKSHVLIEVSTPEDSSRACSTIRLCPATTWQPSSRT